MNELMQQGNLIGLGTALITGFLFSFNPASFITIPVVLAYVTKARALSVALKLGGAFIMGMILTHLILGVGSAIGGDYVGRILGQHWYLLLGPLLIVLGLIWTGWLKFTIPWFAIRGQRVVTTWSAFMLGVPFTVGVCPICSPGLLIALSASASVGSVPYGALLLLMFGIGRTLPVMIGAWSIGYLESLKSFARWQHYLEKMGGITLILMGFYLLNEYFYMF
jgi:cytochrome c-type biogenesis protein